MTLTGKNRYQCPLEHVPNTDIDIKNSNLCSCLLVQQSSTLQQVHLRDFSSQTVNEDVFELMLVNSDLEGLGERAKQE